MKIWTKVLLKDRNNKINLISRSLTNYLYGYGPIRDLCRKYKINANDRKIIDQYTTNRIAGLLLLYLSKDKKRINDIVNKYNIPDSNIESIIPEIEGYIDK
ncbi:MAG: hypothetical protein IJF92_05125 [Bacilli bacterium]|nr:hypothetical protein [Bacilli bacterium]